MQILIELIFASRWLHGYMLIRLILKSSKDQSFSFAKGRLFHKKLLEWKMVKVKAIRLKVSFLIYFIF